MSRPLVYLAGPITGKTYGDAVDWRRSAGLTLEQVWGLDTLSPMRAKQVLDKEDEKIVSDPDRYKAHGPFFHPASIMRRDFNDVSRADALLVNLLGADRVSIGTAMELAWAYQVGTPVVVAIEESGNIHDNHPMVKEAIGSFRFTDLDSAVWAVAVLLGKSG